MSPRPVCDVVFADGTKPSEKVFPDSPSERTFAWVHESPGIGRISAIRFMKNSSRFDGEIARNFTRSSNGVRSSSASCSTRRLNSSQLRSRSTETRPRSSTHELPNRLGRRRRAPSRQLGLSSHSPPKRRSSTVAPLGRHRPACASGRESGFTVRWRRKLHESSRRALCSRLLDELGPERRSTGPAVVTPQRPRQGQGRPHRHPAGKAGIAKACRQLISVSYIRIGTGQSECLGIGAERFVGRISPEAEETISRECGPVTSAVSVPAHAITTRG
jgi:hypothetical protein